MGDRSSLMLSALVAGNAQSWGLEFPPTTFSLTEPGNQNFLTHQSTECNDRNMCKIIIDLEECDQIKRI